MHLQFFSSMDISLILMKKKSVLKEIHEMGFAIGNHTKTHPNLKQISEAEQKEEIISVSNTVEEVIGERPIFFRAPFGLNTDFSRELVKNDGMLLMNWSLRLRLGETIYGARTVSRYYGK